MVLILILVLVHFAPSSAQEIFSMDTLRINSDDGLIAFVETYDVPGEGTKASPFIIQGFTFDSETPGSRVFIGNTSLHFEITDCVFLGGTRKDAPWNRGAGIELYNVNNASVSFNTFKANRIGVLLTDSSGNTIRNNNFENNTYGVWYQDSPHNTALDNVFNKGGFHLSGSRETYLYQDISGNVVGGRDIVYLNNRDLGWSRISSDVGQVILANVSRVSLRDAKMNSNMIVAFSSQVEIENVQIRNHNEEGISIYHSDSIQVKDSVISQNKIGIRLVSSSFNNIKGNTLRGNSQDGILLDQGSSDNLIEGNVISMNPLVVINSHDNLITKNIIFRSIGEGLRLMQGSWGNVVHENAFLYNNRARDIYDASRIQARDVTGANHWNSSDHRGNYWNDWTGPDEDLDGIVDFPYNISGSESRDLYPLTEPTMPVISRPPENLTVVPGNNTLELSWEPPSWDGGADITAYRIYRGELPESQGLLKEVQGDELNYLDQQVSNERAYYYRISAVNDVGESISTGIVMGVPDGIPPELHIIEPVHNSYHNRDHVTASWEGADPNSGVDHYEIRIDSDPWINVGMNTTHTFYDLADGTRTLTVRAVDGAGNYAVTSSTFTIDTTPPRVLEYGPVGDSVSVDANITVLFSQEMDPGSIVVNVTGLEHLVMLWLNETTLLAAPDHGFDYGTTYDVHLSGSDLAGNELEPLSWSFETKTGGTVTGRVVNKDGSAINRVRITLDDTTAFTDEQGEFTFHTYSGTRTAVLTKEGYEDKVVNMEVIAGEVNEVGEITMNPVKASGYDLLLIVASFVVVSTGLIALVIFLYRHKDTGIIEEDFDYEDEDTEELPAEFLE